MSATEINIVPQESARDGHLGEQDLAREWLRQMVRIREFESRLDALSLAGEIPGGVHLAIGQEAVAVGASSALKPDDIITTPHRPHHHALAKGLDLNASMAELFGKSTGTSGGRGGTMHLADFAHGYFPGNAIVGAGVGIAVGAALAAQLGNRDQVACAFVGDGGMNTGRTWESMNLAAIWKLPVIIICENNYYAVETFAGRVTAGTGLVDRARAFGLAASSVDGQDVQEMFEAVSQARATASSGASPVFLEARTYRFEGHSTGETVAYRTDDEVKYWKDSSDPIQSLVQRMLHRGWLEAADVAALEGAAKVEVDGAIEFARTSPEPGSASATTHVNGLDWLPSEVRRA